MSLLKTSATGEIFERIGEGPFKDVDGYIVSINNKN